MFEGGPLLLRQYYSPRDAVDRALMKERHSLIVESQREISDEVSIFRFLDHFWISSTKQMYVMSPENSEQSFAYCCLFNTNEKKTSCRMGQNETIGKRFCYWRQLASLFQMT